MGSINLHHIPRSKVSSSVSTFINGTALFRAVKWGVSEFWAFYWSKLCVLFYLRKMTMIFQVIFARPYLPRKSGPILGDIRICTRSHWVFSSKYVFIRTIGMVWLYIRLYIYVYVYVCVYVCLYVFIYVNMYICLCVYVCRYTYIYASVCIDV